MFLQTSLELTLLLSLLATILGALGVSLAFKDYTASFMAGLIVKEVQQIRSGTRVKILTSPMVKGDVVNVGWLRTTMKEVGDGERLPSVQTGRILKIPNFFLFNNPVLIYGEEIIDEVVVYLKNDERHWDGRPLRNLRSAIEEEGHKVIEIGLFQTEERLVVHGIFQSCTRELADVRSKILGRYLEMSGRPRLEPTPTVVR